MQAVIEDPLAILYTSLSSLLTKTNQTDVIKNSKDRFKGVPNASELLLQVRACVRYSPFCIIGPSAQLNQEALGSQLRGETFAKTKEEAGVKVHSRGCSFSVYVNASLL